MPVSAQETVFQYVGNGVTVTFPYGCQVLQASDLKVYINDAEVTTGFTVNGLGVPAGGTVTFDSPPPNLSQVRLERDIILERLTDYQQNGDFLARVVNPDFNRLWMALQQHLATFRRTLLVPKSDAATPASLPTSAERANKLLSFDAAGNPVAVAPDAQSATALAVEIADAAGAALVGCIQPGAGAIQRTVASKLGDVVSVKDFGALPTNTKAQNKAALQLAIAAMNDAGGGTITVPGDIDYGFVIPTASSYPDFTGCTSDITVIDHGPGDADTIGNKTGAQTRTFYYTVQTTPVGQHDGNGHWVNGNWHPYFSVNNTAVIEAVGHPSRAASDNRRASYLISNNGKTTWRLGQGTWAGAGYTNEELSNFVLEHYQQDGDTLTTYAPLTIERKTGNWSLGEATNVPQASLHVRSRVAGYVQAMFESRNTTSTATLRNSNGAPDDIHLRNLAGDFSLDFDATGTAMRVSKSTRRAGFGVTDPGFKLDVAEARASNYVAQVTNASAVDGSVLKLISSTPSGTGWAFLNLYSDNGGSNRMTVLGNGDIRNANNSYGALSDIKLKENVVDTTPKLADLLRVRIVNFNLKGDQEHKQLGVIAQELEQIFPSLVEDTPDFEEIEHTQEVVVVPASLDEEGTEVAPPVVRTESFIERVPTGTITKGVKYSVFVPILIKALQEQNAELEQIRQRLAALEAQP